MGFPYCTFLKKRHATSKKKNCGSTVFLEHFASFSLETFASIYT
jgi:hypothetical protein